MYLKNCAVIGNTLKKMYLNTCSGFHRFNLLTVLVTIHLKDLFFFLFLVFN